MITMTGLSETQKFYPSTNDSQFLWAGLMSNLRSAFKKAQEANCQFNKVFIFLETRGQNLQVSSIRINQRVTSPVLIKNDLKQAFLRIYQPQRTYRGTSCHLTE